MTSTPHVLSLLVASAAIAVSAGCGRMPDAELEAVERALVLTIVEARRSGSVGSIDVELELRNQGGEVARACLGPSRKVSVVGGHDSLAVVHHPGCVREFAMEPGATMRWHDTLPVSGLPTDRVDVGVEIDVVNPRRCGSAGCPSIPIRALNKREVPSGGPTTACSRRRPARS